MKSVRSIQLPSGKVINVMVESDDLPMHVCEMCESEFVAPTTWDVYDETHWEVEIRCGHCEHVRIGIFNQDECNEFETFLDDAEDILRTEYKRQRHQNMQDDVECFIAVLRAGQIFPIDF